MSFPVFPVDGSLLAAPPFPPSGPGEPGSPLSAVLWRRYDFPPRINGRSFVSLPPPTRFLQLSCLAAALPEEWRSLPGRGLVIAGCPAPAPSRGREWDLSGPQAIRPVPLLRSKTPVESRCPRQSRPPQCCPRYPYGEGLGGTL